MVTPNSSNPDDPNYNCLTCHYPGTWVSGALTVTAAHAPLHDKTDVPDPVACSIACHSPNVIDEHSKYSLFATPSGELDCDRCHKNTNTDPNLGPVNVQETIQLGSGLAGAVVTCDQCHTNISDAGHAAAHAEFMPNSTDCTLSGCHNENIMVEHTNRGWTCSTCHAGATLSLDPIVVQQVIVDAINTSPNPPDMNCSSCHGPDAGTHAADHDQGFFLITPSDQDCTRCHASMNQGDPNQASLVDEHIGNHGLECSTCHSRTDYVFDTINKGRDPSNQPVYCVDCHAASGQGEGHAPITVAPWSECAWCHQIDIFGVPEHNMHLAAAQDLQLSCSACHVPAGSQPGCIQCHSLEQTIWDPLPLHKTAPNSSLNIIGPGTEDHDKHTASTGPLYNNCTFCHVNGVPGSEPLPIPYSECTKCHNGGTAPDITYGSAIHTINHIQGAEALGQSCSYCHSQTPACTNCHQIKGPNMPQHDTHTVTLQYNCTECHINGIAGSEPLPSPYDECSTCHNPAGPGADITYGSPIHTNNHIVGGETSGESCDLCHGPTPPDCSACHAPGHPPIPAPYNQCSTCHDGSGTTTNIKFGQEGHNTHMAVTGNNCVVCHNPQPDCGQCHSNGDHTAAHDSVGVPSDGCSKCHDANVVTEHVTNRGYECATCHTSTDPKVTSTISLGKSGTFVTCYDCHDQNNHHTTTEAQSGNCTYCHADPRLTVEGAIVPVGQLACRQCHIDGNGFVKTGTDKPSHAFNTSGNIQDFGACFNCHQPTPYHAKPTSRPRDCYSATPGKGTFNLFSDEFGGGGEHNERNERCEGRQRDYRNPTITFNMVTIFDYFATNKQWTVPTFGTTATGTGEGGGVTPPPPPVTDTVNITYASYSSRYDRLTVYAENTLGNNASLSVSYNGDIYAMSWDSHDDRWEVTISTSRCSDSTIEVTSSAGGSDSSSVSNCSSYSSWGH